MRVLVSTPAVQGRVHDPTDSRLNSGEVVPFSGIYIAEHSAHARDHEVLLLERETFPACSVCGRQVVFRLKVFTDHVSQNRFFRRDR